MAFPFTFFFSLLLVLLEFLPSSVTSHSNISLGSSLTTASKDPWLSPSGDFAFGFQQIDRSNSFLLAIVFDKMPERSVVWSANRNSLVPGGSTVQLTSDGRLVLSDPSGSEVWTAYGGSPPAASYAAMLDTGNFVLASENLSSVWESFDAPTDTLLPTQILNRGFQLIAGYSRTNRSEGRFKFTLQDDGNLVQYTTTYPQMGNNLAYWATATDTVGSTGNNLVFNQSGFVYLISSNGTVLRNVLGNGASTRELYHRVTLDYDGVLRYYVYPKDNAMSSAGGWARRWNTLQFQPQDVCELSVTIGSGACGFNSYCELEGAENPVCKCPPGYVFLDSNDVYRGCVQNFAPQDCRLQKERDAFDLAVMHNTNFAGASYEFLVSYTEDMCRQACLNDCRCAVAEYDGNCWKKRLPLSNGRADVGRSVKAFIKVRRSNSTSPGAGLIPDKADSSGLTVVVTVLLGTSALVILLLLSATTFLLVSRKRGSKMLASDPKHDSLSMNLCNFSYSELELATGKFDEVLGSGASGTVYKGVLPDEQLIAVKKLDKMVSETQDQEFRTEVKVIGGTNHKNLVKLVGFCNEGQHRILVYEFMSNGSLANLLFGDHPRPGWYTRVEIAHAVARGLVYLHDECSNQIIHCDIKPQNVLLDGSLTAKISDFGLAKLLMVNQTRTMTGIRGTKGYVAPEWFRNMPVTAKVDVHSFGILLLELVCCRKKMELEAANEGEVMLAEWAYECYSQGQLKRLVSDDLEAMADMRKVERFVKVAIWCIQDDPSMRPAMKKVVHMLEGSVHVPPPLDPDSFISSI